MFIVSISSIPINTSSSLIIMPMSILSFIATIRSPLKSLLSCQTLFEHGLFGLTSSELQANKFSVPSRDPSFLCHRALELT